MVEGGWVWIVGRRRLAVAMAAVARGGWWTGRWPGGADDGIGGY